jgi:hypothetical protein
MKHLTLIYLAFFSSLSFAQLPDQSRIYYDEGKIKRYEAESFKKDISDLKLNGCKNDTCANITSNIPEGFGGLSFGSFNGGAQAKATLARYNIHYSAKGKLPLYILATTPIANDTSDNNVSSSLLGTNSGLLNIKIADDTLTFYSLSGDGEGICDFRGPSSPNGNNLGGGCYLNNPAGIPLVDYIDENGKSKQLGSFYASSQLSFEFMISKLSNNKLSKAGRIAGGIGISGYYANTDKVNHLFPKLKDTDEFKVEDLNKWYASIDAGITFTIDEEFSITATASYPLVNDKAFDTVTSIDFTWSPKK